MLIVMLEFATFKTVAKVLITAFSLAVLKGTVALKSASEEVKVT